MLDPAPVLTRVLQVVPAGLVVRVLRQGEVGVVQVERRALGADPR